MGSSRPLKDASVPVQISSSCTSVKMASTVSLYAASTRLRLIDEECDHEAWKASHQFVLGALWILNAMKMLG